MAGLTLEDVHKRFGSVVAAREVNLKLPHGRFVCFLGPSGCGKTTLLRLIAGLESPTQGHILLDEKRITGTPAHKRNFGMVFQSLALFPHLSVIQNITLAPIWVRNWPREDAEAKAMELLELVGIPEQALKFPGNLSGGQQQRVAIARALANDPAIILADEPTGNLDLTTGEEIIALLKRLSEERNVTVISATHDFKMLNVSDQVVWIRDGTVDKIEDREELSISIGKIDTRH